MGVFKRDLARALLRILFVVNVLSCFSFSQNLHPFISYSQLFVSMQFKIPKEFNKNFYRISRKFQKNSQKIPQKFTKKFQIIPPKFPKKFQKKFPKKTSTLSSRGDGLRLNGRDIKKNLFCGFPTCTISGKLNQKNTVLTGSIHSLHYLA